METVTGLFDNRERAEEAIRALRDQGIAADDISVVMRDRREEGEIAEETGTTAASGAAGGGVVGGLAGLLLGLGAITIPGLGPIIAAGPLAGAISGAVTGAAAGGLLGALMDLGIEEDKARAYQRGVERGAVLVTIRAEDEQANMAREIMTQHSRPLEEHRRLWEERPDFQYEQDVERGSLASGMGAEASTSPAKEHPEDTLSDEERMTRDRGRDVTDEDLVDREAAQDPPEDTVGTGGTVAGGVTGGSVGTAGGPRNRSSGDIPVDAEGRREDPALDEALGGEEGLRDREGEPGESETPAGPASSVVGGAVGGPTEQPGGERDRPVGEPASEAGAPPAGTAPGEAMDAEEESDLQRRDRRERGADDRR